MSYQLHSVSQSLFHDNKVYRLKYLCPWYLHGWRLNSVSSSPHPTQLFKCHARRSELRAYFPTRCGYRSLRSKRLHWVFSRADIESRLGLALPCKFHYRFLTLFMHTVREPYESWPHAMKSIEKIHRSSRAARFLQRLRTVGVSFPPSPPTDREQQLSRLNATPGFFRLRNTLFDIDDAEKVATP